LVSALLTANLAGVAAAADRNSPPIPCEAVESVGLATMSADGTITLALRAWPKPPGENRLVYAPGDPQYGDIKRHLDGIAPGQSKEVPPWCGTNSEP
jgi:hypothetical protein